MGQNEFAMGRGMRSPSPFASNAATFFQRVAWALVPHAGWWWSPSGWVASKLRTTFAFGASTKVLCHHPTADICQHVERCRRLRTRQRKWKPACRSSAFPMASSTRLTGWQGRCLARFTSHAKTVFRTLGTMVSMGWVNIFVLQTTGASVSHVLLLFHIHALDVFFDYVCHCYSVSLMNLCQLTLPPYAQTNSAYVQSVLLLTRCFVAVVPRGHWSQSCQWSCFRAMWPHLRCKVFWDASRNNLYNFAKRSPSCCYDRLWA